jgi:hypothetical protein
MNFTENRKTMFFFNFFLEHEILGKNWGGIQ